MRLYTVHHRRHGPDADSNLVLIKEGFCWPAFLFLPLWALWHRLWVVAVVLLGADLAVGGAALLLHLDALSRAAVALGFTVIVGFVANDVRRRALERRQFTFAAVVAGADRAAAERRLLEENPELVAELGR